MIWGIRSRTRVGDEHAHAHAVRGAHDFRIELLGFEPYTLGFQAAPSVEMSTPLRTLSVGPMASGQSF